MAVKAVHKCCSCFSMQLRSLPLSFFLNYVHKLCHNFSVTALNFQQLYTVTVTHKAVISCMRNRYWCMYHHDDE